MLARTLTALRRRPRGLVADVDGTIAAIAPTPQAARVAPACRAALQALMPKLDVLAFISGRAATEAAAMVGVPGAIYVGNHGLDWCRGDAGGVVEAALPYVAAVRDTVAELKRSLDPSGLSLSGRSLPGVIFEDKGPTASIHYRRCRAPRRARAAILAAVAASRAAADLRVSEAKMLVELRPPLDIDKGTALRRLLDEAGLRSAVYIGDDITDIAAFRALAAWRADGERSGLAIAVADAETPPEVTAAADLWLDGVADVERMLAWLAEALD